jgi:hypothetical protein
MTDRERRLRRRVRVLLVLFVSGLVSSGLTAFALETELQALSAWCGIDPSASPSEYAGLERWIATVTRGLRETNARYPFMAYGTDWLAFGHLVIAVMFVGPLRDPVRYVWVVTAGMVACAGVVPLAILAGEVRGIPFWWRLLDCAFGVGGIIPLWLSRRYIVELETLEGGRAKRALG